MSAKQQSGALSKARNALAYADLLSPEVKRRLEGIVERESK